MAYSQNNLVAVPILAGAGLVALTGEPHGSGFLYRYVQSVTAATTYPMRLYGGMVDDLGENFLDPQPWPVSLVVRISDVSETVDVPSWEFTGNLHTGVLNPGAQGIASELPAVRPTIGAHEVSGPNVYTLDPAVMSAFWWDFVAPATGYVAVDAFLSFYETDGVVPTRSITYLPARRRFRPR